MSLFDHDRPGARLPVSVVTGFLGSGKTTLLNRLLRQPSLADTAVIVNELGEVGLDHLLMERIDGETVLLAGGCLCCAVRSDLETTLRDLAARRHDGAIPPFARVAIETTGLADPGPIVQLLLNHPLVSGFYRLDGVVTTVDAVHGDRQLDAHPEALKQVAIADRLLITKADLVAEDGAALERLRGRLAALNPGARLDLVGAGAIAPEAVFGIGWSDPDGDPATAGRWLSAERYPGLGEGGPFTAARDPAHRHAHAHVHSPAHDPGIATFCLIDDSPLPWLRFQAWLGTLRSERGADLLRVKGILNLAGESRPLVIHGVHHVFHPPVLLARWPDDDRRSRIVFITRGLAGPEIAASWRAARAGPG